MYRQPIAAMLVPTRKMTRPPISGGSSGRMRFRIGDNRDWMTPANMVMPKTSGRPPNFRAAIEGSRKIASWHGGHRNRLPTRPLGSDCRMAATPSAISDRLSMLTEASVGSAASWMTSAKDELDAHQADVLEAAEQSKQRRRH